MSEHLPARVARQLHGGSVLARALRPVVNRLMPTGMIEATVRSGAAAGITLCIDPRREKYYWMGTYEPAVQSALVNLLQPGDVVWDVGAHIGFYTAIAARLVGSTGEIAAFEPFAPNVVRLNRMVSVNRFENVRVRPVAVSKEVGHVRFYVSESTSMGSLALRRRTVQELDVVSTTLDAELDRYRAPSLLKIDIEGAEEAALLGASRLMEEVKPRLLIELLTPDSVRRTCQLLPSYGFRQLDARNYLALPR